MKKLLVLCACIVAISSCRDPKKQMTLNKVVKVDKVIKLTALELNDKVGRKKFDILVKLENLSDESIIFFLGEMSCSKGDERGKVGHAFFGAGERSIDLKLNQMKKFRFVCSFDKKVTSGSFKISLGRVFENPNNDGRTSGKLLKKKITLTIPGKGKANGTKA